MLFFTKLRWFRNTAWVPCLLALSACNGQDQSFGFLDASNSKSTADCAITNSTPTSSTFKVSSVASTQTQFTVGLTDTSCEVVYTVNGVARSGTSATLSVASSELVSGANTVVAKVGATTRFPSIWRRSTASSRFTSREP